ncbi:MBL fold metallo-hydrolase [Streptomyces sp. NBC_01261]|uniref:MBL fold metallo-hydrolase n=1 Tax=Streptomyces sp. NBC_01261 TaxID=2903802 RepID=UPI002E323B3B|nr:MBL fold metallo-hydrolase [Streptomyces sp. NBC_01261]
MTARLSENDDPTVPNPPPEDGEVESAPRRPRRWRRRIGWAVVVVGVLIVITVVGGLIYVRTTPFGASPSGDRQARIERSPQWRDGEFRDPQPLWMSPRAPLAGTVFDGDRSDTSSPNQPLHIAATDTSLFDDPPADGLRITWFGHSSTLMEIDGTRVLIDPFWGEQAGPNGLFGRKPFYPAPAALADLGPVDVVVISHDHWDHLDQSTVRAMSGWAHTTFVVPLGIGADLERWGVPSQRIRELDWWQTTKVGSLELVSTPARHNSGRDPLRSNETLWSGWALRGPQHRAWYSGDTGYAPALTQIGERLGPFDVTLIESGEYDPDWPDQHLGPELAVRANGLVGGKLMVPVHWGLFDLAPHSWTEPVERVRAEAECQKQSYLVLVPGVPTEPTADAVAAQRQWWPKLPWRTAAETPINPTVDGDSDERVGYVPCVLNGR